MSIVDIAIFALLLGVIIWALISYFFKKEDESDEDPDKPREWKD